MNHYRPLRFRRPLSVISPSTSTFVAATSSLHSPSPSTSLRPSQLRYTLQNRSPPHAVSSRCPHFVSAIGNSMKLHHFYSTLSLPMTVVGVGGAGRYFLVRAGESQFESMGVINTNPVAKTSVDSGLSKRGKKQAVRAAFDLKEMGACDKSCWIWPAITQRAYQTAEIIASVNGVSRSFIVPEYSFLDARGLGAYEGKNLESMSEIYALDSMSPSSKPPPVDDGTPNESVTDVFVRVTQLMSILETQYSGDTVVIVSPDSDNLTILQAGLIGLDLRRHRDLSFAPGEVRFVDTKSIPSYKQPASAVYKCLKPPNCN